MERSQKVLNIFCKASGAKVNWNKSAAIWASKRTRTWEWGQEVGLQWVQEGKGVGYLGIQVGFRLPLEVNFDKMLSNLKNKLINWSTCHLSLAGRILVVNQALLASMWYLAASWNPNPIMCSQVRGVVRNFIWGEKATTTRAKVKWDTLVLPTTKGGLGIIDPKTQFEALLAKLLIKGGFDIIDPKTQFEALLAKLLIKGGLGIIDPKTQFEAMLAKLLIKGGLGIIDPKTQFEAMLAKLLIKGFAPGGEPWKELLRHKADQVKLPTHSLGPNTQDIHWIFSVPKLKRPPCSMWKSILGAWMSVRPGLSKSEPTNPAKWLRLPVFVNPTITNSDHRPLGLNGKSEGNVFASTGCSRIKDFEWKSLSTMGVSFHTNNRQNKELITNSIP
jgi:hypothetical protein